MQVPYIKNFIEASMNIFEEFLGQGSVKFAQPQLCGEHHAIMGFAVIIGLTGDIEGRVVLDMEEATALAIAKKINERDFEQANDELVQATMQEIGNMIAGRAITLLNELSQSFDITPPALLIGENMVLNDAGHEIVSTAIETESGEIDMTLVIYESE